MRNPRVQVASGLSHEQSNRAIALLLSMSIDAVVASAPEGGAQILVAAEDEMSARELLAEEFPLGIPGSPGDGESDEGLDHEAPEFWFGKGSLAVLGVAAACIIIHLYVHQGFDGASRSRMIEAGAVVNHLIVAGEHWRFVSAIFLHFNLEHLVGNLMTLVFVGPPLAYMLGRKRFLLIFLLTGIAGNLMSFGLGVSAGIKAGASGAIAGVLGAIGGHALRPRETSLTPNLRPHRHPSLRTFGAMAACYAMMIGVSPEVDNIAHVGGLVAGIALGRWMEPPADGGGDPDASSEVIRRGSGTFR